MPPTRLCLDHPRMQSSPSTMAAGRRASASRSFYAKVLDLAQWVVDGMGLPSRPLSAGELMDSARRRTELLDFGEEPFEEPLRILTESYEREACLSLLGRIAARWDTLRFLSNLLTLREAEKRNPAILNQGIERPIFITGLPRSGTTFLHNLLSRDASNRFVRCWEAIYPCAGSSRRTDSQERRANKVDRQLNGFARLAPELRRVHPINARSPQECTEITAHTLRSMRFDTTHHVPGYARWLDRTGHLAAYRFHRRFLQHRQNERGTGRWVLKSPDHVFALDAIRAVYPDARFVFMHRNPLDVLPSVAKLTEVLRAPFTRAVNRRAIGEQVMERWVQGAGILVEEMKSDDPCSIHLQFQTLVHDPLGTVFRLYDWLGAKLGIEAEARIRQAISAWPQGRHPGAHVRLEDYGLSPDAVGSRYREYTAAFDL
jgi:hypothetical protein